MFVLFVCGEQTVLKIHDISLVSKQYISVPVPPLLNCAHSDAEVHIQCTTLALRADYGPMFMQRKVLPLKDLLRPFEPSLRPPQTSK